MSDRAGATAHATKLWRVFLLRGVAGLLLGISVILGSENTEKLASFIAAYWLIGALLTIRWVLAHRGGPAAGSGWLRRSRGSLRPASSWSAPCSRTRCRSGSRL
jgi:uncharacterized membrane protein HdeD (DUF308 family)